MSLDPIRVKHKMPWLAVGAKAWLRIGSGRRIPVIVTGATRMVYVKRQGFTHREPVKPGDLTPRSEP